MNRPTRMTFVACCLLPATLLMTLVGCALNPDDGTGANSTGAGGMGASTTTSSGVDRGVALSALTNSQAGALCDWTNMKQGGYGRDVLCTNGRESTSPTETGCVNATLALGNRCAVLTVGKVEDCANATGTDLCKLETETACLTVTTCGQ